MKTVWYTCYYMSKKDSLTQLEDGNYRKQLEDLYARRVAIDALIESLEDYGRCRAKRIAEYKRNAG